MLTHLLLLSSHSTRVWGITQTLSSDPSTLRDGRGTLGRSSQASRKWGVQAEQPVKNCILTCSRGFNAGFSMHITQILWQPSSRDKVSTEGQVWAHSHCGIKALKLFKRDWRGVKVHTELNLTKVGHWLHQFFPSTFWSGVFCGAQIQTKVSERTRSSLWKMAITGKKPQRMFRFCILQGAGMG